MQPFSGPGKRILLLFTMCLMHASTAHSQSEAEEPEYSREGADSCFACHDDQVTLAIFRTRHAVPSDPNGPFGHGQLQCEACHGPSGDHAGRVRRGQERPPAIGFGSDSTTPTGKLSPAPTVTGVTLRVILSWSRRVSRKFASTAIESNGRRSLRLIRILSGKAKWTAAVVTIRMAIQQTRWLRGKR